MAFGSLALWQKQKPNMKKRAFFRIVLLGLAYLAGFSVFSQQTAEERKLWEMEIAYWEGVKSADIDAYIGLYHEDHISWPSFRETPSSKAQIEGSLKEFVGMMIPDATTYRLRPLSVSIDRDQGHVYYHAQWHMTTREGISSDFEEKFYHVWQRTEAGWRLKGGMSFLEQQKQ